MSYGNTDVFTKKVTGYTVYGTFDLSYHLGAEADYHSMTINTPNDFALTSFLIGPRYVWHYRRYDPYVKVQVGRGHAAIVDRNYTDGYIGPQPIPMSTFDVGFGGGVDVHFSHHLNVRGDFVYQDWTGFKQNGLTPYVATLGVAYRR